MTLVAALAAVFLAARSNYANAQSTVNIPTMQREINIGSNPQGTVFFDLSAYPKIIASDLTGSSLVHFTVEDGGSVYLSNGCGTKTFTIGSGLSCTARSDDGGRQHFNTMRIVRSGYDANTKQIFVQYSWETTRNLGGTWWITLNGGTARLDVQPPTLTFTADNANLPYGGATTLRWSSSNTLGCVASGGWGGSKPTSGAENTGTLTSNKSYTLTCVGQEGNIERTININVAAPAPPSITFSASPASIRLGESSTLSWSVGGVVSSCSASGAWSDSKPTSGSQSVTPPSVGNHTYTLACSGPSGNDSRSRTITVSDPVLSSDIKANGSDGPINIGYNQPATISWTSTYSQFPQYGGSCSVSKDGTSFSSGTSGSQSTGVLKSSETYSISCTGALGSASDSVIVNVAAPTLSVALSANPPPPPGTASSYTTALTANTGGTAIGTINYSLWWNCNNSTANVSTASSVCSALPAAPAGNCSENSNGVKCEAVNSPSLSRPHTFTCPAGGGTCDFRPKVITERDSLSATNAIGAPLLTILEPPRYFTLSKNGDLEAGVSVNPLAESNKIQLTVNPFNLFDANVSLSVESGMPAGGTARFGTSGASSANLSAPYPKTVDFWVTIPRATATGGYTIKVRGVGGGVSDTINIPLNVTERRPEFREI